MIFDFDICERDEKFHIVLKVLTEERSLISYIELHKIFFSYFEDLIATLFMQGYDFVVDEDFSIYTENKEEALKIIDWFESLKMMIQIESFK